MLTLEILLRLIAGAVLVAANAFFVATEFALTRLRQFSEAEIRDDPALRTAWGMTERLEIHLTGCQLGISVSSILLGVVAEPAVSELLAVPARALGVPEGTVPVLSVVTAVVAINLIHQIWGEQAPTYLGVERPRGVARRLAPLLLVWSRTLGPLIRLGDWAAKATLRLFGIRMTRSWTRTGEEESVGEIGSHGELLREMGELLARGSLTRDRRREVIQALAIERIPVRRIMVPREEVTPLSTARSVEENFRTIGETGFVRYPLLDAAEEEFVGTIYVPTLFRHRRALERGEATLDEVAAPGVRVPADLPVSRLIDRLQEERQEVALVEEEGRIVGLVTITDAFEAIAGEVTDPFD